MISTEIRGQHLVLGGSAARPTLAPPVRVTLTPFSFELTDNDTAQSPVAVPGGAATLRLVDLRGLMAPGVHVYWDVPGVGTLLGGAGNDYLYAAFAGDDRLAGGAGHDTLSGNDGHDRIEGGAGHDVLRAGRGDDTLSGGAGDDRIDGEAGTDRLILTGARADYDLSLSGGQWVLAHARGTGRDGVDVIANVEVLQFTDQTLTVDTTPRNLSAAISSATLAIAGTALPQFATSQITVELVQGHLRVGDADAPNSMILSAAAPAGLRHLDLSALTGVGAYVYWDSPSGAARRISGSGADDFVFLAGTAADRLTGGNGHDNLQAGAGADTITAGQGNDSLTGGAGDDLLIGNAGVDLAVFAGPRADYGISRDGNTWTVTHLGGAGADGTDLLQGIEQLRFADQTVTLADLIL